MSVVAISLVELREMVRISPDAPAKESNLSELELRPYKTCANDLQQKGLRRVRII
jgi:hypothetical protein